MFFTANARFRIIIRDDRLLQSARLLRKICDSLVSSSEEEEDKEELKIQRKRERKVGEIRLEKRNSRSRSSRC